MASSGFGVQQPTSPTKPSAFGGAPSFGGNVIKYWKLFSLKLNNYQVSHLALRQPSVRTR